MKNMEVNDNLKNKEQKLVREQKIKIRLELPKLEYSKLKKLENYLLNAGARYDKWEISASKSSDGKKHEGKSWSIYKTEDVDIAPFKDYIKEDRQERENQIKKPAKKRKSVNDYEKARIRKVRHEVRTTEIEDKILREKAEFCNMNVSRYLIKMGIDGYIVIQDLKRLSQLANEIGKIGVNINQIAHKVNSDNVVMDRDMKSIKASLDDIYDMIREVIMQNNV